MGMTGLLEAFAAISPDTRRRGVVRFEFPSMGRQRNTGGRRAEVESSTLSPQIQLGWIPAGDHSFRPTRSSGRSEEQTWAEAVALSDGFLRRLLHGGGDG